MDQRDLLSNDLLISETSQANLNTAAKWGKFLAIVGFLFCGLMLIGGILMQMMPADGVNEFATALPKYVGITYSVMAVILFFPCLYLLKFSNKIEDAIRLSSQESLDSGFINLKSMFKFYGIFTIIMLFFLALAFLGGLSSMLQ